MAVNKTYAPVVVYSTNMYMLETEDVPRIDVVTKSVTSIGVSYVADTSLVSDLAADVGMLDPFVNSHQAALESDGYTQYSLV